MDNLFKEMKLHLSFLQISILVAFQIIIIIFFFN
jgi:hypothetical protein